MGTKRVFYYKFLSSHYRCFFVHTQVTRRGLALRLGTYVGDLKFFSIIDIGNSSFALSDEIVFADVVRK